MPYIARLTSTAAAEYRALMLSAYADEPEAFTSTAAEREPLSLQWWITRVEEDAVFGTFTENRLVGVAGFHAEHRERISHKATLFGMFVAPSFRGDGIGRSLVEAVLDHAQVTPLVRVVQLTVTESNDSAIGLYESCGFVRFGSEPYAVQVGDGFVTKVHMWYNVAVRAA